ncbi:MAG: hypothetical protein PHD46_00800 [Eubacteriales bacterium]|nr:hypothetical protein [Eubacteriales bacterium]MDD4421555.1 hypothetical protein [Eubacteriales bacterium]HBR32516.1 hypothetical protein [Clostridiales bacterium]
MKKQNVLWIILGSIIFIVFNFVFYMTDMSSEANSTAWTSYIFIIVSFITFIATPVLTGRYQIKRKIFGIEPTEFGAVYFAAQLIIGIVLILAESNNFASSLLIQLSLLAIFAIILVINLIISEKANTKAQSREEDEK